MFTPARLLTIITTAALAATMSAEAVSASPAAPSAAVAEPAAAAADRADVGRWQVVARGAGRYEVRWTAPRRLPSNSDRPTISGGDLPFGPSTIAADRRTVTATVTAESRPRPADLDVLLSGDRLDEPGSDVATRVGGVLPKAPATTPLPATDPAQPGPFTTVTSDYDLPGVKLPGMPEPIEMVGHVVEPAADQVTGPRPLVLFLHGRHGVCYNPDDKRDYGDAWPCKGRFEEIPSHLGYVYVQNLLASQGYTTVSIRVNGINAQDYRLPDGGADARSRIVAEHLDYWTTIAAAHQSDLSQVVLVGHSRGGEGVDRASIDIPLSAPYTIAGQVLIAPTDFASHTAPYVPTVTLLPYCDGDVYDIQGQKFTDYGRDLVTDDTSLKSSVLVMGANHNFFNTEWTPSTAVAPSFDDWGGDRDAPCGRQHPGRLKASGQRAVGKAYIAGAVKLFLGDDGYLPLFDGSHVTVPSIGDADVRSHALGGGRDTRRPGIEATPTAPSGGADTFLCRGTSSFESDDFGACGRGIRGEITPHWTVSGEATPTRQFFEMSWTEPGAVGGLRWDAPLDLTTDRLELRTIVDARQGPVDVLVRITDSNGDSATLTPEGGSVVEPLLKGSYLTKLWAQSLLVDASGAVGVDLSDITSVSLVAGDARGRVWVADVSAAPAALAPVPGVRLPQVNVGTVTIAEGNPSGTKREEAKVAKVPYTIAGTVTKPSRFVVVTAGQERGAVQRFVVNVAPGQTGGTIPVAYTADRLDDYLNLTSVQVWGTRGLATDRYLGALRIEDDDPDPVVRIKAPKQVKEGGTIVLDISLSTATSYDTYAYFEVVRGPGRDLKGSDVPLKWLQQFNPEADVSVPLWQTYVFGGESLRSGETTARFEIPVLADNNREGPENLTLRIGANDTRKRLTIAVVDTSR